MAGSSDVLHRSEFRAFIAAFKIQFRVVGALVLREMNVRYGNSQFGYLWAIIEPAGFIAAFSVLHAHSGAPAPFGQSMPLFFSLGIIPFRLFTGLGNQLGGSFNANEALLGFPIVKKIDTLIARWFLEVITTVTIFFLTIVALHAITDIPWPNDVLRAGEGFFLLAGFGLGVGMINAVIISYISGWQNIFRMMSLPLMFLSGVFYSLDSVPDNARDIITWNPLVHAIEIIRDGYYTNYRSDGISDFYILSCCVISILLGLTLERAARGGRP